MHRIIPSYLIIMLLPAWLVAHDTLLRPESHLTKPNKPFEVAVFTGDFDRSVYPLGEERVEDLSVHTEAAKMEVEPINWQRLMGGSKFWQFKQRVVGKLGGIDQRDASLFEMSIEKAGSVVLAVDFEQERIALELDKYQTYLDEEAYDDLNLAEHGFTEPEDIIVEAYTKIGKTIIQVGDSITDNVTKPVGQRIELVPLSHPAKLQKGQSLSIQVFYSGKPLAHQSIVVGYEPGAFKNSLDFKQVYKSDQEGIIQVPLNHAGIWWANTIFIEEAPADEGLDFISWWGSLTFEIN